MVAILNGIHSTYSAVDVYVYIYLYIFIYELFCGLLSLQKKTTHAHM